MSKGNIPTAIQQGRISECPIITNRHSGTLSSAPASFDTIKFYSKETPCEAKQPETWRASGDVERFLLHEYDELHRIIPVGIDGNETEHGNHVTTIGIKHSLVNGFTVINCASAPAVVHGTPMQRLTVQDIPVFQERLRWLVEPYLKTDLDTFGISRLDTSTIFDMEHETGLYIGLLNAMTPAKQRRTNKKHYEAETVQFTNKSYSIGFYDKVAKEHQRTGMVQETSGNMLRYELQLKKASTTRNRLKAVWTFNDLHRDEVTARMVQYRSEQFKKYFPFRSREAKRYENEIEFVMNHSKRNAVKDYALMQMVLNGHWTLEHAVHLHRLAGNSERSVRKFKRQLEELLASNRSVLTGLYDEVRYNIEQEEKAVA